MYNPQTTLLFNVDFCTSKGKYYISFRKRYINKDENVHKFAISAIRGKLLEREREKKRI